MTPYKIYINWKVKLLDASDPQNLNEFMERYKVKKDDIVEFQNIPSYEEDLRKASLSWLQSKIPELLHVAYKEAKESKSVSDIEKLVDIAHALKKKGETGGNQFNFFNLPDETINRIAKRQLEPGVSGREARLPTASSAQ